jgi:hypothetical protein
VVFEDEIVLFEPQQLWVRVGKSDMVEGVFEIL